MEFLCNKCGRYHNIIKITKEDTTVTEREKFSFPIYVDNKEYLGTKCKCGAICIKTIK